MMMPMVFALAAAMLLLINPAGVLAQVRAPELAPNLGWLNTDRPLRLKEELKGHVVVLDFWTLGCINCIHILPDLEYLESKYRDRPFAVIGVHSAKFANEAQRQAIRSAMQRYGVHHPVVIDDGMKIWDQYTVRGWPGFVVIGADGYIIGAAGGEGNRDVLDRAVATAFEQAERKGTLARTPFKPRLDASVPSVSGLAFPGKVIAAPPVESAKGSNAGAGWVFISDTAHHRVIAASWPDAQGRCDVRGVFGSGEAGLRDGEARQARFYEPQGLAFDAARSVLYVADRRNHAIRAINLDLGTVTTVCGDGEQGRDRRGGGVGRRQRLSSPWDVALARGGGTLYIAMAGPHQLWQVDVNTGVAKVLAGSGREAVVDGDADSAALAQPSGLSLSGDGRRLYFADSESSAVRYVDLDQGRVGTLIGTGLFDFGDVDGAYPDARLQHALGVAAWASPDGPRLLVADTYNHKIKLIDPAKRTVQRWMSGRDMTGPGDLRLDEPGGLFLAGEGAGARLFVADTNNHRIVVIDPSNRSWRELMIEGLTVSAAAMPNAAPAEVQAAINPGADVALRVSAPLPGSAHLNAEIPVSVRVVRTAGEGERRTEQVLAQRTSRSAAFPVELPILAGSLAAGESLRVDVHFAYCTDGDNATCVPASRSWRVRINRGDGAVIDLK